MPLILYGFFTLCLLNPRASLNEGGRYVLQNVEFVYIPQSAAEIDFKNPPEQVILRYDTDKAPQIPFEHPAGSGTWLWDAFECQNGECPYAKQQQKPLVYSNFNAKLLEYAKAGRPTQPGPDGGPGFDPAMEMDIGMAICPVCKTGGGKQIRTPERAAKDQELHERVMRENS